MNGFYEKEIRLNGTDSKTDPRVFDARYEGDKVKIVVKQGKVKHVIDLISVLKQIEQGKREAEAAARDSKER